VQRFAEPVQRLNRVVVWSPSHPLALKPRHLTPPVVLTAQVYGLPREIYALPD